MVDKAARATAIRYCGATCHVTTADDRTHLSREFDLRFEIDHSADGLAAGQPVIAENGMRDNAASVRLSRFQEISSLTHRQCI